jgi:hypothetical protein
MRISLTFYTRAANAPDVTQSALQLLRLLGGFWFTLVKNIRLRKRSCRLHKERESFLTVPNCFRIGLAMRKGIRTELRE